MSGEDTIVVLRRLKFVGLSNPDSTGHSGGGAAMVHGGASLSVGGCVFVGNSAHQGGCIWAKR
eukprot:SAG22_NODE_16398_length_326_cov_0.669604_1_plen_62_part_01